MSVMTAQLSNRASAVKSGDVVEGRYRILDVLGEGGMGTVFLAEHALIKRRVAIKILHPELATDSEVIERFMNEARAAGTLGHPNIVESTDMGFTHDHVPYIVFEFLEGSLLTDEIYRVGGMPVRRAIRIAQQIASALHAAHIAGIVHRDLKSDNIFLTDKDEALDHVKVLDFGISRFLQHDELDAGKGVVMGTPEFMAPEQITDPDSVDRRADIYALGVILYEMLACRRPFSAEEDPRMLMERIVRAAPPPLDRAEVPQGLVDMIMTKLLAKHPADRYGSMQDVEAALDAFTTQTDVARRRPRPAPSMTGTSNDVGRLSGAIARPAGTANTPWHTPPLPASAALIGLARTPDAKTPWLVYGLAAAGLLVGAGGLAVGLRGTAAKVASTATQPQPTASAEPAKAKSDELQKARVAQKVAVVVEANAPGARVTFRRRVLATPAKLEVPASDIVEVVEVSAPGYATKRYWLTFDRATTLNAQLSKGAVAVEATDEETLVALGEMPATTPVTATVVAVAAPDTVAAPVTSAAAAVVVVPVLVPGSAIPAAVAGSAVARTVAKTVAAPMRKVGHAATVAPELAVIAAAPDEPVAMIAPIAIVDPGLTVAPADPTTPPIATAQPSLAVEPAPGAAVAPTAAISTGSAPSPELQSVAKPVAELAKRRDVAPEKSAPAPEPGYAAAQISTVFGQHRGEIVTCVDDGNTGNKTIHGTLELQLQIDASGRVKRVQMQSNLKAPLVAACIVKAATGWRFPARAGSGLAAVKYPFVVK